MSWLPDDLTLDLIQIDTRFGEGRVQPYQGKWRGPIMHMTDKRMMDVALHNIDATTAARARAHFNG